MGIGIAVKRLFGAIKQLYQTYRLPNTELPTIFWVPLNKPIKGQDWLTITEYDVLLGKQGLTVFKSVEENSSALSFITGQRVYFIGVTFPQLLTIYDQLNSKGKEQERELTLVQRFYSIKKKGNRVWYAFEGRDLKPILYHRTLLESLLTVYDIKGTQ